MTNLSREDCIIWLESLIKEGIFFGEGMRSAIILKGDLERLQLILALLQKEGPNYGT
jgi:hypothetical protein